jgi:hypothetical protein
MSVATIRAPLTPALSPKGEREPQILPLPSGERAG